MNKAQILARFLKEHEAYPNFIRNRLAHGASGLIDINYTFQSAIIGGFNWSDAPETSDFWYKLHLGLCEIYTKLNQKTPLSNTRLQCIHKIP